jgi:hypothetical protein
VGGDGGDGGDGDAVGVGTWALEVEAGVGVGVYEADEGSEGEVSLHAVRTARDAIT